MQGLSRQQALTQLRARIEHIEKRPLLAEDVPLPEGRDGLLTPPGVLHEVFADARRHGGAALGFALGSAKALLTPERPVILCLQLARDAQEMGLPYGAGLKSFGLDPDRVVIGRMEKVTDLLWAMEEVIACRAVAAVIAEMAWPAEAMDFTASRRLSLRAASAGTSAFLVRYGTGREASAARFRWRVTPILSGAVPFDPSAPGGSRWRMQLEKGRLGPERDPLDWILDWTENGFVSAGPQSGKRAAIAADAPLSGAAPAALGHRLSQTG